jgi:hypothetical protein
MDQSQPPSSTPSTTPAPTAPEHQGQTAAPTTPPTPAPPPDPYQPSGFTSEDWEALAGEAGMPAGELQAVFAPARQVAHEFGGGQLAALLESDDPVFGSLGNDPNLIRALGKYGDDMRAYLRDERQMVTELRSLAAERGQRLSNPAVPELRGQALQEAVDQLISRYIQDPNARRALKSSGVFSHPTVRHMLVQMAQVQHRSVGVLSALSQQREQWRGERDTRREQAQVSAMAGEVRSWSEAEYQSRYGELFQQYQEASSKGRWMDKQRISEQMTALAKARWG